MAGGAGVAGMGPVPSQRLAILTCMDVRIDPRTVLGLALGEAHILRNAGARVTDDVIRSLVISQQALGTNAVVLMPHTECGVLGLDPADILRRLGPEAAHFPLLDFRAMHDLSAAIREDLARLRESPWIVPSVTAVGLILDIRTGLVRRQEPPAP